MLKKLYNMAIKEISGVTKGANRKTWLITKSEGGDAVSMDIGDICQVAVEALGIAISKTIEDSGMDITKSQADVETSFDQFVEFIKSSSDGTFLQNIAAKDLRSHIWEATDALYDAVGNAIGNPDLDTAGKIEQVTQDLADFSDWLVAQVEMHTVSKAGAIISADRLKRLKETHAALGAIISEAEKADPPEGVITKGDGTEMTAEEIKKAVDDALGPIVTRLDALEKGDSPEGDPPAGDVKPDDVTKTVTEAVTKAMEPLITRLEVVEKAKGIKKSIDGNDDPNAQQEVKKSMWANVL